MNDDILYCADHHFLHGGNIERPRAGIIAWCDRPFDNIEDMTDALIENHNAIAQRSTDVYILGDFALGKDFKAKKKIFDKLNGRKHLIIGNHDKNDTLRLGWSSEPVHRKIVNDGPHRIFLDHYPIISWDGLYKKVVHFHGHTHGRLRSRGRLVDVGIDAWNLAPVRAEQAIARMQANNRDFNSYLPEERDIVRYVDSYDHAEGYGEPEYDDMLEEGPDYDPVAAHV